MKIFSWFKKSKTDTGPTIPFYSNPSGKIIAAKVVSINKHPNADRLQIVEVFDGSENIAPVVCGAFNFKVGDIVVLAQPGAKISQNIHSDKGEEFILEKAKIRGVESQGMLCAEYELGLSQERGTGIMILPSNIAPGTVLG
jgi:phenylalanyl-tRNA synthetase beta chain